MERTYTVERAAHARSVAAAKGRRIGRPSVVDPDKLAYAAHVRETGQTIAEIVAKTGIARTSVSRHDRPSRSPPYLPSSAMTGVTGCMKLALPVGGHRCGDTVLYEQFRPAAAVVAVRESPCRC